MNLTRPAYLNALRIAERAGVTEHFSQNDCLEAALANSNASSRKSLWGRDLPARQIDLNCLTLILKDHVCHGKAGRVGQRQRGMHNAKLCSNLRSPAMKA